jgi:hypothetical protein
VLDGYPISFLTFPYEIRSTVIEIGGGELSIHSPVQISTASLATGVATPSNWFSERQVAPNGCTPPNYRWTFFRRKAVRQDLRETLSWNAKRIVVNHCPIVETGALEFLTNAFQWTVYVKNHKAGSLLALWLPYCASESNG